MGCKVKKAWVNIEMEHSHLFKIGDKRLMAKKIAKDHIAEMGCSYYPSLIKMEKKLTKLKGKKK